MMPSTCIFIRPLEPNTALCHELAANEKRARLLDNRLRPISGSWDDT